MKIVLSKRLPKNTVIEDTVCLFNKVLFKLIK